MNTSKLLVMPFLTKINTDCNLPVLYFWNMFFSCKKYESSQTVPSHMISINKICFNVRLLVNDSEHQQIVSNDLFDDNQC